MTSGRDQERDRQIEELAQEWLEPILGQIEANRIERERAFQEHFERSKVTTDKFLAKAKITAQNYNKD